MKRLALALALLSSPAFAGTITVSIAAPGTNGTKAFAVSDADVARLVAAYQSPCNARINGTCTKTQVLLEVALAAKDLWTAKVKSVEAAAAQAALPPPANIPMD
jgi:hypothetical protein